MDKYYNKCTIILDSPGPVAIPQCRGLGFNLLVRDLDPKIPQATAKMEDPMLQLRLSTAKERKKYF